jgi:membrane protease YdiL (CAAX protease family)
MDNIRTNKRIILTYIAIQLLVIIGFIIYALLNSNITELEENIISATAGWVMGIILVLIFAIRNKNYFVDQFYDFRDRISENVGYVILMFFLLFIANIITNSIMIGLGVNDQAGNQASIDTLLESTLYVKWSMVVYAVLLAPFVEEVVFRKAIMGLVEHKKAYVGVLLSGFFFGLIHVIGDDFIQIINYFIPGCVIALIYLGAKRNIYVVIFGHMLFNSLIFVGLF